MYRALLSLIFCLFFSAAAFAQGFTLNEGAPRQPAYQDTIAYTTIKDKILVPVRLNGKVYTFLLDTGAPTMISHTLQQELKPKVIQRINVSDANTAQDSMDVVRLSSIEFGSVAFENTPTLVSAAVEKTLACFGASGIIGSNMLRNSVVMFDSRNSRIIISHSAAGMQLDKKYANDIILDRQSTPVLTIIFDKKNREQLIFDSGSDGFYELSQKTYKKYGTTNIMQTVATGTGSSSASLFGNEGAVNKALVKVPNLQLGNVQFKNIVTETIADEVSRIGAKVLQYGVFTIDYPKRKMYLQPYTTSPTIDAYEKEWNVTFTIANNQLLVGKVWDAALGVMPGDRVIRVNGMPTETIDPCEYLKNPLLKNLETAQLEVITASGTKTITAIKK